MDDPRIIELLAELVIETKGSRTELSKLNEKVEQLSQRTENLEMQAKRTNLVLSTIKEAIEELRDRQDFDTVHYNQPIEIEIDGVKQPGIIRRKRPDQG